jgi:uncharacterized protein (TIGR02266 family)
MKTVAVASGSAAVRDRFVAALESAGHRAIPAGTATALLDLARAAEPPLDLIVLDMKLPEGGGVEMVRPLRELRDGQLPVLVFSGSVASAEEVRELVRLGIAGYLNEHSAAQYILPSIAPHLFPDNFNRRSGPRVPLGVSVQYRFGNTIAAALTLNLGSGGLAIRTTSPLERGSMVKLRFRTPGSRRDIDAEGRVVWSDRRAGMGLQFEKVDPAGQAIIDNLVDAHGSSKPGH